MCGLSFYSGSDAAKKAVLRTTFCQVQQRGPDQTTIHDFEAEPGWLGFHRLRIMDTSEHGDQPFFHDDFTLMCNGEIYNHHDLKSSYPDFPFQSDSDCEVILPLLEDKGIAQLGKELDGEFAVIVWQKSAKKVLAVRDPIGIRPLFYGQDSAGEWYFSSLIKNIAPLCTWVKPFPPGHYFDGERIHSYQDYGKTAEKTDCSEAEIFSGIAEKLEQAVVKRLEADVPVGFLLSGGLDSSLVCALAQRHSDKPIRTFAVGIEDNPIDTKYARITADFLGTDHTEVLFSKETMFFALERMITALETWDITTIRASVGMYLVCKHIRKNTDIKVVLTGEVSDEIFGYKYTDFAPSPAEFQAEAVKRVREIYAYDVLRADRCIAIHGLEARVPFSDHDFVDFVMSIPAEKKMNTTGIGKYLLRKSFVDQKLLPEEILWREKAAFSDAVGHAMVDGIKKFATERYSDIELEKAQQTYAYHCPPHTKESLLYRDLFEKHFPGQAQIIPGFWLPNQSWKHCDVTDPSARELPNYGKSGR